MKYNAAIDIEEIFVRLDERIMEKEEESVGRNPNSTKPESYVDEVNYTWKCGSQELWLVPIKELYSRQGCPSLYWLHKCFRAALCFMHDHVCSMVRESNGMFGVSSPGNQCKAGLWQRMY